MSLPDFRAIPVMCAAHGDHQFIVAVATGDHRVECPVCGEILKVIVAEATGV